MKSYWKLILISFLLLCFRLCGNDRISEIETKLDAAMGREKVNLLLEKAEILLHEDLHKSREADSLALKLSRQARYRQGEWRSLNIAGRILLASEDNWKAIDYFESAKKLLKGDDERIHQGVINGNIALAYNGLGWSDKALAKLKESEKIYKELEQNDDVIEELVKSYLNQGTIYLELGRYEESLAAFLSGMQEVEKIENYSLEAKIKGNIGRVYQSLMNPALSLEYYRQALEVHQKTNNKADMAEVYGNMGTLYSEIEDFEKALTFYEKSLEVYRNIGDQIGTATVLGNIGSLYYYQQKYEQTLDYYNQTLNVLESLGAGLYQAYFMNNIGMVFLEMGRYARAEVSMNKAMEMAKEFESLELEAEVNSSLSDLYLKKGDANTALEFKERSVTLRDSIFAATTAAQIAEMQTKYDTERKQRENTLLRKDNEIKELELERKEIQRNYILALAVVGLVLVIFIYNRYRSKKKSAEILANKNEVITRQKEELSDTLDKLRKTQKKLVESEKMASLGSLVTGVAHEINTPVGIIITAASNLNDRQQDLIEKYNEQKMKRSDLESFLNYIEKAGKLILSNSQRTGELVKSFKKVSVDQSTESRRQFKIRSYIQDVLTSLEPKFKGKDIDIRILCDEYLVWNSYPGIFAQIITNLVINSLVHGFKGHETGEISFKIARKEDKLSIVYKDNGSGMSGEVIKKIFDPFFTTNKQTGTGLGMHIIYNLVTQKLHGSIKVESKEGEGSSFIMDFPFSEGGLSEI